MAVDLPYRQPNAVAALLRFLGDRTIPGVEAFDGRTIRRAVHGPEGDVAVIRVRPTSTRARLATEGSDVPPAPAVIERVRRWLDVDTDPNPIDAALARDPKLRPSVRSTPGLRLPGAIDGFEMAVRAVLGQQVSVRAARTFAGRIAVAVGAPVPADLVTSGTSHAFPTAERLADAKLDTVGLTTRRRETLRALARLVADGELDLSGTGDLTFTRDRLLAIDGVGPWTVEYISMRALGDPDAFPASDLGVRLGFDALGLPSSPSAIKERAERWRPWRGYATMRLWHTLGGTP